MYPLVTPSSALSVPSRLPYARAEQRDSCSRKSWAALMRAFECPYEIPKLRSDSYESLAERQDRTRILRPPHDLFVIFVVIVVVVSPVGAARLIVVILREGVLESHELAVFFSVERLEVPDLVQIERDHC